jgi:hypothetical protein
MTAAFRTLRECTSELAAARRATVARAADMRCRTWTLRLLVEWRLFLEVTSVEMLA